MTRVRPANRHEHSIVTLVRKTQRGNELKYHIEFARDPSGAPYEVMCYPPKQDSDDGRRIADFCVTLSLMLQHGGDIKKLMSSMRREKNGKPASLYGEIVKLVKEETDDRT